MERLRAVARASGAPTGLLVRETVASLQSIGDDPQALLVACQRLVQRNPRRAPLIWLAAHVVTASDPLSSARSAAARVANDTTVAALAEALPENATLCVLGHPERVVEALRTRGDVRVLVVDVNGLASGAVRRLMNVEVEVDDVRVEGLGAAVAASDLLVLEADALGPDRALVPLGSLAAATVARHHGVGVWMVGGVARWLPARMFEIVERDFGLANAPWDDDEELLPLGLVDHVAGPDGLESVDAARRHTDCPIAPELLRLR
jgi:hypothetical protein